MDGERRRGKGERQEDLSRTHIVARYFQEERSEGGKE